MSNQYYFFGTRTFFIRAVPKIFGRVNGSLIKLLVTFTKRLSFKARFEGHSIIMYLNHASTKDVINTQNQCQIWIYLNTTCCVQLNIVL